MIPLFFVLFASFASVQGIALLLGSVFVSQQVSIVENPSDVGNSVFFFAYIVVSAIVLLLILKFYKGKKLFFVLELLLYLTAIQIAVASFFSEIIALGAGIAAVALRFFVPKTKNALLLASTAVVGAVLGSSLDLFPAAVFAVLLSGYDFVAVFVTKHMVELAEKLEDRGAAFSVTFGDAPEGAKVFETKSEKRRSQKGKGGVGIIELGTGDLVIPAMLSVSALKIGVAPNFFAAISVSLGTLAGLAVLFWALEKRRGYLPALPPIVFFSLLFLAIEVLVSSAF